MAEYFVSVKKSWMTIIWNQDFVASFWELVNGSETFDCSTLS